MPYNDVLAHVEHSKGLLFDPLTKIRRGIDFGSRMGIMADKVRHNLSQTKYMRTIKNANLDPWTV